MKKILVICAHPDDEFLGCGATLLHYVKKGYKIKVVFLSDGETSRNINQNEVKGLINRRKKQAELISKKANFQKPIFFDYPDNRLDKVPILTIIKKLEKEIRNFKPEIIFTHQENDLNIDHSIAFKASLTASRPMTKTFVKKILCFETPSSSEISFQIHKKKLFNPNLFVDISFFLKKKINLLKIYKSEIKKYPHARSLKNIENLAKYRGSQVGLKYAEAFYILRQVI